jgi:hypothetical protein
MPQCDSADGRPIDLHTFCIHGSGICNLQAYVHKDFGAPLYACGGCDSHGQCAKGWGQHAGHDDIVWAMFCIQVYIALGNC